MQLIKLATFTALIMTVSAAVPGVVHLRDDVEDSAELFERASCSNIAAIKRPNKYEKEGYAIPVFDSLSTGFLICYRPTLDVSQKDRGASSAPTTARTRAERPTCVSKVENHSASAGRLPSRRATLRTESASFKLWFVRSALSMFSY